MWKRGNMRSLPVLIARGLEPYYAKLRLVLVLAINVGLHYPPSPFYSLRLIEGSLFGFEGAGEKQPYTKKTQPWSCDQGCVALLGGPNYSPVESPVIFIHHFVVHN